MNTSLPSNIFLLKRSIDLSLLRQGFHIPPEFHARGGKAGQAFEDITIKQRIKTL